MVKRPTIKFNGSKDNLPEILERAASRLHMNGIAKHFQQAPPGLLLNEMALQKYIADRNQHEEDLKKSIATFIARAREPWDMEHSLSILSERVTLIDLDNVFVKIGKRWSRVGGVA